MSRRNDSWVCPKCGYTELYRGETDDLMNVIDFLL